MHLSPEVELGLVVASAVVFVATLVAVPMLVVRLPADHFVRPPTRRSVLIHFGRNVVGGILVAVGLAMLVLPGQGVITILIGLSVLDLPIKHRLIRRILSQPRLEHAIQRLRERAGKPPLEIPDSDEPSPPASERRAVNSRRSRAPSGSAGRSHA
ncbi:PGPGW domain-containing protein [Labilithrix luteola]|uniref:PGPGW domain-containing protein n=1 Tax=Labilithrix luteola TaxID=1391654 RepID=UPI0011BA90DB|nr:PGPGW domain-containing protein [Labilithrix luteola]